MFADMFGVSVLAVVVIAMFWKYIPLFWWLLWLGPLWLYFEADHHVSEKTTRGCMVLGMWQSVFCLQVCLSSGTKLGIKKYLG